MNPAYEQVKQALELHAGRTEEVFASKDPSQVVCPHCHEEIELDENEVRSGRYVCPECNRTNTLAPLD